MAEAVTALAEIGVQVGAGEQQVGAWQMSGAQQTAWKKLETLVDGEGDLVIKPIAPGRHRFQGPAGDRRRRRASSPSCVPTRKPASIFSPTPRASGSARCWPTTWASAKPCRRWRGCSTCARSRGPRRRLVICPASVVFNWNREAAQFTPEPEGAAAHRGRASPHACARKFPRTISSSPTTRCCAATSPRCKNSPSAPSFSTRRRTSRTPSRWSRARPRR